MGLSSPIAMQVGTVNGSLFSTLWQENILFNDPSDDDQIVHECPKLGEAVRKKSYLIVQEGQALLVLVQGVWLAHHYWPYSSVSNNICETRSGPVAR